MPLIISLLGIFNNAIESKDKVKLSQLNESTLHIEERDGVTSTQDDKDVVMRIFNKKKYLDF